MCVSVHSHILACGHLLVECAFAGHTAVCLKDEIGSLLVGESGHENEIMPTLPLIYFSMWTLACR
jgi:hypothetical protein